MQLTTLSLLLLGIAFLAFQVGRGRAERILGDSGAAAPFHSRPRYHGYFLAIRSVGTALVIVLAWVLAEPAALIAILSDSLPASWLQLPAGELEFRLNAVRALASGADSPAAADMETAAAAARLADLRQSSRYLLALFALSAALLSGGLAWRRIAPDFRARSLVERALTRLLVAASSLALLTTIGIVLSVLFEALRFFREVPVAEFLFGLDWSPQTAIRADQAGSSGRFGAVPLFAGTVLVTCIAMSLAVPVGLMTAVYLSEYSKRRVRNFAKPLLEVLAGIPTVVYGFFAAVTVAPILRDAGAVLGVDVAAGSALGAGLVMGIMILPLVSSMSDDAIRAVPTPTREAALALGSTRAEMLVHVVMPAAMPGIVGGVLLAVSRAVGETMIVVMAAGLAANLTANPFEAVTTVTVQIVTLLIGDQEFDSAKTLAAFALGLVLFLVTLVLNMVGLRIVRRYRRRFA